VAPLPALVHLLPRIVPLSVGKVALWVTRGVNIEAGNGEGQTPLMLAARLGRLDLVAYLVSRGVWVNAMDCRGYTAFALAASAGHLACVRYLRSRGANPNAVAPLLDCVRRGMAGMCRTLLAHGTQVDLADRRGNTALMVAASHGHCALAQRLLHCGANHFRVNHMGLSAWHLALRAGHYRLAALLETGDDCFSRRGLRHLRYAVARLRLKQGTYAVRASGR
jgi:ankyrin repeat protein